MEGKQRMNVNLEWLNIPSEIVFVKDIKTFMLAIQSLNVCTGCKFDNYETVVSDDPSMPVYHTRSGEPAAFVETNPSQHHKKVIRPTFCLFLCNMKNCYDQKKFALHVNKPKTTCAL